MPLDFPNSPNQGDTWTGSNGVEYIWDGTKWVAIGISGAQTGPFLPLSGGTLRAADGAPTLSLNGAASGGQGVQWQTGGQTRWQQVINTDGSGDLWLNAYGPTGAYTGTLIEFANNGSAISTLVPLHATALSVVGTQQYTNNAVPPASRWFVGNGLNTESGGDSGSDFEIVSNGDTGVAYQAMSIKRSTSDATFRGKISAAGGTLSGLVTSTAPETAPNNFGNNLLLDSANHFGTIQFPDNAGHTFMFGSDGTALLASYWNGTTYSRALRINPAGNIIRSFLEIFTIGMQGTGNAITIDAGATSSAPINITIAQPSSGITIQTQVSAVALATGSSSGPTWTTGSTAPSSTQPVGSLYSCTGGAVGATLYVSRGGGTWAAVAGV